MRFAFLFVPNHASKINHLVILKIDNEVMPLIYFTQVNLITGKSERSVNFIRD